MNKTILIVAAHPDDEVLGCFATVARLIKEGYNAYTLILSKGKTSREGATREELDELNNEMLEANKVIGIKEVFQCDFPDNAFDSVPLLSIIKEIEKIKDKIQPEIIFTHHRGDINIDHKITFKAVLTATRPLKGECVKKVYSMEVPSSTEWGGYSKEEAFIPNTFFDVSDTIELKIKAMGEYQSELREYPHPRSLKYIEDLAKINGARVGLRCSENFILIRNLV